MGKGACCSYLGDNVAETKTVTYNPEDKKKSVFRHTLK